MDFNSPEKKHIAHEILAYLHEHPDAQDTLEGIVQWWLLERKLKYHLALVGDALDELIAKGLILEQKPNGSVPASIRLNNERRTEIAAYLSKMVS